MPAFVRRTNQVKEEADGNRRRIGKSQSPLLARRDNVRG
jgi:hypothetical protein